MPPEERRERFARFIEAVEDGERLDQACKLAGAVWGSIGRWIADERNRLPSEDGTEDGETFAARYARARAQSAALYESKAEQAAQEASPEDVQVARLKVDVYKWRAAMADPKGYGDRKQVEITGGLQHLHLDALRAPRVSVKATLANPMPDNGIGLLGSPIERPEQEPNRTEGEGPPDSGEGAGVV